MSIKNRNQQRVFGVFSSSRTGAILLTERSAKCKNPGQIGFPGGRVDAGETLAQALVRELQEELGITTQANYWRPVTSIGGKRVLMKYLGTEQIYPKTSAEVSKILWTHPDRIKLILPHKMHKSLLLVQGTEFDVPLATEADDDEDIIKTY